MAFRHAFHAAHFAMGTAGIDAPAGLVSLSQGHYGFRFLHKNKTRTNSFWESRGRLLFTSGFSSSWESIKDCGDGPELVVVPPVRRAGWHDHAIYNWRDDHQRASEFRRQVHLCWQPKKCHPEESVPVGSFAASSWTTSPRSLRAAGAPQA